MPVEIILFKELLAFLNSTLGTTVTLAAAVAIFIVQLVYKNLKKQIAYLEKRGEAKDERIRELIDIIKEFKVTLAVIKDRLR
jgi:flagellin-specific chaperone FliS